MKKYLILFSVFFFSTILFAQGISPLQQQKMAQALSAISALYVDSINDEKVIESAIKGVLEDLDPHSTYTPKEEVQRMHEPLEGNFDGIGVQFQIIKDTINIVQTISGAPAEKVGALPGDKIIFVDNENVAGVGIKNSDVLKKLRGKRGTSVMIKVKRNSVAKLLEFRIVRDKIPLHSVDASYMVTDKIGFIKINSFGQTTHEEFMKALQKLKSQGMKDLILSLESNGGGYLSTAIQLADEFLKNNQLIVYTKGLHTPRNEANATHLGRFEDGRLIVLVDDYSASASEIVSGAVQDWDRGVIIGRRTFGKGLVQREISLIDGSLMRLTIARYFTPTGRSIQKPYQNGKKEVYYKELEKRFESGEMMHADSIHFPDSLRYNTLLSKRTVYGGGGIMPDVFIPIDTTENTAYHRKLVAKGVVNSTTVEYLNKNRKKLKSMYPQFSDFKNKYQVDDDLLKMLIANGKTDKVEFNEKEYKTSERLLKLQLKALLARDLFEVNEYFQIMETENKALQKAIQILQKEGEYERILSAKE